MFLKLSESKLPKFSYKLGTHKIHKNWIRQQNTNINIFEEWLKNSSLDFPWKKQKNEIIEYLPEYENSLYWQIIYDLEMKQKWNVKY